MIKVGEFFLLLLLQDSAMFQISSQTITTAGPVISVAMMKCLVHFAAGVKVLNAMAFD